jgi:hypothetical protein
MTTAFPLQWPHGWPRTPPSRQGSGQQFKQGGGTYQYDDQGKPSSYTPRRQVTFAVARDKLYAELERLAAINVIISSNHKPDIRGVPIESKRSVGDEGVAVYFTYMGKAMVMACDRFDNAAANMRSLGLAIEALRQLERHGGGTMMERAFTGFEALPPPDDWRRVLELGHAPTREDVTNAYRHKARTAHPDGGGDDYTWHRLQKAYEQAMREIG